MHHLVKPIPQIRSLDIPLSKQETYKACLLMNPNASLTHDGFGPRFYRKSCHHLKHQIIPFFPELPFFASTLNALIERASYCFLNRTIVGQLMILEPFLYKNALKVLQKSLPIGKKVQSPLLPWKLNMLHLWPQHLS